MSKLVMIDSQLFIWGIEGVAKEGQEGRIGPTKRFIEWLAETKCKLLLPVPMMVELLSHVPPAEQVEIKALFDKRFRVVPFDTIAAEKCAELIYNSLTNAALVAYRAEHKVTKATLKFDCMLVAIAITNRVSKIYSDDPHLKKFAAGQIDVEPMPIIPEQGKLDFEPTADVWQASPNNFATAKPLLARQAVYAPGAAPAKAAVDTSRGLTGPTQSA